jgi:hypothetical protein
MHKYQSAMAHYITDHLAIDVWGIFRFMAVASGMEEEKVKNNR